MTAFWYDRGRRGVRTFVAYDCNSPGVVEIDPQTRALATAAGFSGSKGTEAPGMISGPVRGLFAIRFPGNWPEPPTFGGIRVR